MEIKSYIDKGFPTWVIVLSLWLVSPLGAGLLIHRIVVDRCFRLDFWKWLFWICVAGMIFGFVLMSLLSLLLDGGLGGFSLLYFLTMIMYGGSVFILYKILKRKTERYKGYIRCVGNEKLTSIDEIAAEFGVTYEKAEKELFAMIKKEYFAGAYIDRAQRIIVMPEGKEPEGKWTVVICPSCGGDNKIAVGTTCDCKFCGKTLSDTFA